MGLITEEGALLEIAGCQSSHSRVATVPAKMGFLANCIWECDGSQSQLLMDTQSPPPPSDWHLHQRPIGMDQSASDDPMSCALPLFEKGILRRGHTGGVSTAKRSDASILVQAVNNWQQVPASPPKDMNTQCLTRAGVHKGEGRESQAFKGPVKW